MNAQITWHIDNVNYPSKSFSFIRNLIFKTLISGGPFFDSSLESDSLLDSLCWWMSWWKGSRIMFDNSFLKII